MGNVEPKLTKKEAKELSELVNMSVEDIKEWHKEYRKSVKKKRGKLTVKEFREVYNTSFQGDANQFAEHVFRTFDIDGNGEVDFREFIVGLSVSSSSDVETKLRWAFNMYDIDKSGTISREEMETIIRSVYRMAGSHVKMPDDISTPERLARKLFDKIDANGDGELTWDEFKDGAMDDPMVVRLLTMDPDT